MDRDVEHPSAIVALPPAAAAGRRFTSFTIDAILLRGDGADSTKPISRTSLSESETCGSDFVSGKKLMKLTDPCFGVGHAVEGDSWLRRRKSHDLPTKHEHVTAERDDGGYVDLRGDHQKQVPAVTAADQLHSVETNSSVADDASDDNGVGISCGLQQTVGRYLHQHQQQQQQQQAQHHGGKMQSHTMSTAAMTSPFYAPFQRHPAITSHPFLLPHIDGKNNLRYDASS
jgi:hypothetical protein